jgi:hypothetical protein
LFSTGILPERGGQILVHPYRSLHRAVLWPNRSHKSASEDESGIRRPALKIEGRETGRNLFENHSKWLFTFTKPGNLVRESFDVTLKSLSGTGETVRRGRFGCHVVACPNHANRYRTAGGIDQASLAEKIVYSHRRK